MNALAPAIRATEIQEETNPCVVIIRPEFMQICNNDACKSATLNHVLYWIAQKIKKGVQYWYATGEQIWEGMNKSWGITTIRKAVKELVNAGFLGQRRNPKVGIDQTRQYFFGKEQADTFMQACEENHVCVMCLDVHKDIAHLIDLSNGDLPFDRFVKCICQICQMHLTDLLEQYQRLLTKITDKEESVIPSESSGESNSSSSSEDEIARRYKKGYQRQDLVAMTSLLTAMDDAFLAEQEAKLYTSSPHNVDIVSHSHSQKPTPISNAPAPPVKETRKRSGNKKVPDAIDISAEGMAVYRDWCSLFKVTVPLNKAIAKAANELVEPVAVWSAVKGCSHKEVLKLIKNWLYENDKNGYYSRGVKLYDIAREFEGWQSKQEQPQSMNGTGKKYKPSPDEELVEWQGQVMTVAEADKRGFNGGFGEYVSQQQF